MLLLLLLFPTFLELVEYKIHKENDTLAFHKPAFCPFQCFHRFQKTGGFLLTLRIIARVKIHRNNDHSPPPVLTDSLHRDDLLVLDVEDQVPVGLLLLDLVVLELHLLGHLDSASLENIAKRAGETRFEERALIHIMPRMTRLWQVQISLPTAYSTLPV